MNRLVHVLFFVTLAAVSSDSSVLPEDAVKVGFSAETAAASSSDLPVLTALPQVRASETPSPTQTTGGLLDFQKLMNGAGGNLFNLRLPTLTDLFSLPGSAEPWTLPKFNAQALEGLPTFAPLKPVVFPEFKPFVLSPAVTVPPRGVCIAKMEKEIRDNVTYFEALQKQVDESIVDGAYEVFLTQAAQLCDAEQVDRLKALFKKYEKMQENIKALAPEYSTEVRQKVLGWVRDTDLSALSQFIGQETMASLFSAPPRSSKLMETSFQMTMMQIDLFFNPI